MNLKQFTFLALCIGWAFLQSSCGTTTPDPNEPNGDKNNTITNEFLSGIWKCTNGKVDGAARDGLEGYTLVFSDKEVYSGIFEDMGVAPLGIIPYKLEGNQLLHTENKEITFDLQRNTDSLALALEAKGRKIELNFKKMPSNELDGQWLCAEMVVNENVAPDLMEMNFRIENSTIKATTESPEIQAIIDQGGLGEFPFKIEGNKLVHLRTPDKKLTVEFLSMPENDAKMHLAFAGGENQYRLVLKNNPTIIMDNTKKEEPVNK